MRAGWVCTEQMWLRRKKYTERQRQSERERGRVGFAQSKCGSEGRNTQRDRDRVRESEGWLRRKKPSDRERVGSA